MSETPETQHPATGPEDLGFELPAPANSGKVVVFCVIAALAGGAFTFGYLRHRGSKTEDVAPAGEPTSSRVEVMKATVVSSDRALVLPGVVRPLAETKLYPRINGYVRKFTADIGDKVKEGQVLAEIDSPELDAQLAQARAQVAQAQAAVKQVIAQRDYSKASLARYVELAAQKLVAQAQVEQTQAQAQNDEANLVAQQANVVASQANVNRLVDLLAYSKVTAPFDGTVTARYIDRGTAVVGDQLATPLYVVAATDPVRIFVDVPQNVAPNVKDGTVASVSSREYGDRQFPGTVARSAGALDPILHTMMTELRIPNHDGALLPGMYVQAAITLPVPHRVLEVPVTALYSDAQGLRLATVDATHKVHFAPITIERDTGGTLWVGTGLTGDENIVKIAVPSLLEGDVVEVAPSPPPAKPAAGSGSGSGSGSGGAAK